MRHSVISAFSKSLARTKLVEELTQTKIEKLIMEIDKALLKLVSNLP